MTDIVLEQWPVTDSFLAMLRAGTQKSVFDAEITKGEKPPVVVVDGRELPDVYFLVYEIGGGSLSGPWGQPHADAEIIYQVTAVGPRSRRQARAAMDLARKTILERVDKTAVNDGYRVPMPLTTAGWSVVGRVPHGTPGGNEPAGTEQSHPFSVSERYAVIITPS